MAIQGVGISTGFTLNEAKGLFFDRQKAITLLGRNTTAALAGIGGYLMRYVRYSIRHGSKPSAAGSPPHTRGQKLLKRFVLFFTDPKTRSVVVGPVKIKGRFDKHTKPDGGKTIPQLLEEGGGFQRLQVQRQVPAATAAAFMADLQKQQRFGIDGPVPLTQPNGMVGIWHDVETVRDWRRAEHRPTRWVHRNMSARPYLAPALADPKTQAFVDRLLLQLWSRAAA